MINFNYEGQIEDVKKVKNYIERAQRKIIKPSYSQTPQKRQQPQSQQSSMINDDFLQDLLKQQRKQQKLAQQQKTQLFQRTFQNISIRSSVKQGKSTLELYDESKISANINQMHQTTYIQNGYTKKKKLSQKNGQKRNQSISEQTKQLTQTSHSLNTSIVLQSRNKSQDINLVQLNRIHNTSIFNLSDGKELQETQELFKWRQKSRKKNYSIQSEMKPSTKIFSDQFKPSATTQHSQMTPDHSIHEFNPSDPIRPFERYISNTHHIYPIHKTNHNHIFLNSHSHQQPQYLSQQQLQQQQSSYQQQFQQQYQQPSLLQSQQSQQSQQLYPQQHQQQQQQQYQQQKFYVLKILNGFVIKNTSSYRDFQVRYQKMWNMIEIYLKQFVKYSLKMQVQIMSIDGQKIVNMIQRQQAENSKQQYHIYQLTDDQMIECIEGDIMKSYLKMMQKSTMENDVSSRNSSRYDKDQACRVIVRFLRGIKFRKYERYRQLFKRQVKVIQRYWRSKMMKFRFKRKLKEINEQAYDEFRSLQSSFYRDWQQIQFKKRYEIHINTFSEEELIRLSMNNMESRLNTQLNRIFRLKDPLLRIIYVVSGNFKQEIQNYYLKILELQGIDYSDRIFFLRLNDMQKIYPENLSLLSRLIFDFRSLKRIRSIINNQVAYIVGGKASNLEIKLASLLKIPLYGCDPQKAFNFNQKSGAKRIINSSGVPLPYGTLEIYEREDLYNSFTLMILRHPEVKVWIFKIENECYSRGTAYCEIDEKILLIVSDATTIYEIKIQLMKKLLPNYLSNNLRYVYPQLFPKGYSDFISTVERKGCVIEAYPGDLKSSSSTVLMIGFDIQPNKNYKLEFSMEKIQSEPMLNCGIKFPFRLEGQNNIQFDSFAHNIVTKLVSEGVTGFGSLDFVVFWDDKSQQMDLWGFSIELGLNDYFCSYFLFQFLTDGQISKSLDQYHCKIPSLTDPQKQEQRGYVYIPLINAQKTLSNTNIIKYFYNTKLAQIDYNMTTRQGITFQLMDSIQIGDIGILCISSNTPEMMALLNKGLTFIKNQDTDRRNKTYHRVSKDSDPITHIQPQLTLESILSKCRIICKRFGLTNHSEYVSSSQIFLN